MPSFRDQIKTYIDGHWMVPCEDGIVWTYYAAINTKAQIAEHKKATKKDWARGIPSVRGPNLRLVGGSLPDPPDGPSQGQGRAVRLQLVPRSRDGFVVVRQGR